MRGEDIDAVNIAYYFRFVNYMSWRICKSENYHYDIIFFKKKCDTATVAGLKC